MDGWLVGWGFGDTTRRAEPACAPHPAPPSPTLLCRLLRYVLPACGGRDADVQRVLAAGAVLLTAGDVLAALAPSRLQPHPPDWQFQVMAFDGCLSNSLFSMAEALDSAHSLPPQLEAPATLLAWMRQAAAAMGEVRSARGE